MPSCLLTRRAFLNSTVAGAAAMNQSLCASPINALLSGHRMKDIEIRTVSLPWPRDVGRNAVKGKHGHGPIKRRVCVLHTDKGATGWGEMQGGFGKVQRFLDSIKGRTVAELIDPATGIRSETHHAIDIPLHDCIFIHKILAKDQPRHVDAILCLF